METLIATAFGRYVDIQRGEADQLTEAAAAVLGGTRGGGFSPDNVILVALCMSLIEWVIDIVTAYYSHF